MKWREIKIFVYYGSVKLMIEDIKKGCQLSLTTSFSAERVGFEPTVPFWSTHTFQACSFDHSDISPDRNFKADLLTTQNSRTKVGDFFII